MAGELNGKKVAFLATDGVEQVELDEPRKAVEEAGAETAVVSLESGEIQAFNHLDHGDKIKVDVTAGSADASQFDALVLPGGRGQPRLPAPGRLTQSASSGRSSSRTSRLASSVTGHGLLSRRMLCAVAR